MEQNTLIALCIFIIGTFNIPLALNKTAVSWFNWIAFGFCCGLSCAALKL